MKISHLLGVSLLAAAAFPLGAVPLTPAEVATVDAIVAKEMARTETPSVSVAIVRDGEIAFTKAYGNASDRLAATTSVPYQIASNSKQFTAMALLLLEDEGKLSLDDKVAKHLPGVNGGDRVTLRQLLDHTAGIEDFWPQDYSFPAMEQVVKPREIVDRWAVKPLGYVPGTKWQYSNTGYVIAGLIAEKVSGETLFAYLKRRVFNPLGMTSVIDQDDAIGAAYPVGYGRAALGPVRAEPPAARGWLYAAGGLAMTASDLAKWDIARINRSLVPADDWEAQETATKLADGSDTGYGLGVGLGSIDGHRRVGHTGESVGFLSSNQVYPDDKAAIVVMTNTWSGNAFSTISRDIRTKVLFPQSGNAPPAPVAARIRTAYDLLREGKIDRALFTPNANYYFTPQRIADYGASLAPLGAPQSVEPTGEATLRGGFVIRSWEVKYPTRTLDLSVFTEPGDSGRIEQFLVSPGE